MEKYLERIRLLEKELRIRDDEARQAAIYGNQLLRESAELKAQIEKLKQDKHSLQFRLDTNLKLSESQMLEIDAQKDTINEYERELQYLKKEHLSMNKRLQEKVNENQDLRKSTDELVLSNNFFKKQISDLEKQLQGFQNQLQVSLNETNSEEFLKLSSELQKCQEEKGALLSLVSETEHKFEKSKNMQEKYFSLIESLRQTLNEKNNQIQSYSSIVEKAKEENVELMGQVEMLKLEQVDVTRRGNSVFGEVEDRRKAVEKEFIILKKKHACLTENYNIRLIEMRKLKHQMDIFLGMFSEKVDYSYMDDLETKLRGAQKEIEYLTKRLAYQIESQDYLVSSSFLEKAVSSDDDDGYAYLRALLLQSRDRIKELEKELQEQRMLKFAENDQLIETKRLLYHSQKKVENLKGETLQLRLKLQDLTMRPGDEKEPELKKEIIPGFLPIEERKSEGSNVSFDKIKGTRSRKTISSHKEKENNNPCYDLFYALKNPVPVSVKNPKQEKKVTFSRTEDQIIDVSNKRTPSSAPVIDMGDGNYACAQQ